MGCIRAISSGISVSGPSKIKKLDEGERVYSLYVTIDIQVIECLFCAWPAIISYAQIGKCVFVVNSPKVCAHQSFPLYGTFKSYEQAIMCLMLLHEHNTCTIPIRDIAKTNAGG